jgi:hypothetical protein
MLLLARIGVFAGLFLVASSGVSDAVIGTPPTVSCGQCGVCVEAEGPSGRCLKCSYSRSACHVAPPPVSECQRHPHGERGCR